MKIVFKKIPKFAQYFYWLGSTLIFIALSSYFSSSPFLNEQSMQQVFVLGAIAVAIGSVINYLFQFKKNKP